MLFEVVYYNRLKSSWLLTTFSSMIGSFFFSRKEYALNLESLDGNITVQVLIHANDILPIPFTASIFISASILRTLMSGL